MHYGSPGSEVASNIITQTSKISPISKTPHVNKLGKDSQNVYKDCTINCPTTYESIT